MENEEMPEKVLDAENWKLEANAVVRDIENHVRKIEVLDGTHHHIFFNVTTMEGIDFCIELSGQGFRVAGRNHDEKKDDDLEYFETPYSLLNKLSPSFHQSFGNELINKLSNLSKN